jgi:hypothetical protein
MERSGRFLPPSPYTYKCRPFQSLNKRFSAFSGSLFLPVERIQIG